MLHKAVENKRAKAEPDGKGPIEPDSKKPKIDDQEPTLIQVLQ
jgi:hypothetical protein